jgi:hypothetical protein
MGQDSHKSQYILLFYRRRDALYCSAFLQFLLSPSNCELWEIGLGCCCARILGPVGGEEEVSEQHGGV